MILCFSISILLTLLTVFIAKISYLENGNILKIGVLTFIISFSFSLLSINLASNDFTFLKIETKYVRDYDIYKTKDEIMQKLYGVHETNDVDQNEYFYYVSNGKIQGEQLVHFNIFSKDYLSDDMKFFEIETHYCRKYNFLLNVKKVVLNKYIGIKGKEEKINY